MRLIVNADDFGLTMNVSKGILEGMKAGVISDTSAIVNTRDFIESAQMAIQHGVQAMGIHLLLTMGEPLSDKEQVKNLLNERNRFCTREQLATVKFDINEVRLELKAQITRFLSTGLQLTHIDTHHGFMNHSKEMAALFVELSKTYQVPLRNEASRLPIEKQMFKGNESIYSCEMVCFNRGAKYHSVASLKELIHEAKTKYDCIEIGCHPGYSDDRLRQISELNDAREMELLTFMNPSLKDFLEKEHIYLEAYKAF